MKDYTEQKQILKDAEWFAERGQIATAISLVDDAFDNFLEFRTWYITESNPNSLFDHYFCNWVAKIMIVFYYNHCVPDIQALVELTYYELYKEY